MKIVSFELTMPNRGSWNDQWSRQDKKSYVVKSISDRYLASKEHFKELIQTGKDGYRYSWDDGWTAIVRAEIINITEAKRRRKISAGFCGYEWMIDSIIYHGQIMNSAETKRFVESQKITQSKVPHP